MTTSQVVMFVACGCIALAWIASWVRGHRGSGLQHIFAALLVQALAATLLAFSSASLLFSLCLAGIILIAALWLIGSGNQFGSQRLAGR